MIPEDEIDETQAYPEAPTTRLTAQIFSVLLPALVAKDKTVRYRSAQTISHIVNCLDSLDDEYYRLVRTALLKRMRDKEPTVRVQAAIGLGRLAGDQGGEGQDEDMEDETDGLLLDRLLEILQNDSSADVRKTLLLNLPITPATLPFLLERARDQDAAIRRALYSRLLPALGDFRHLSLSMREKLLRWGLKDRDEQVRKSTAKVFRERWIEDCAGTNAANEQRDDGVLPPDTNALLELLERIDVVNSGNEAGTAHVALKEFWEGRPDYREAIELDEPFWESLTSESVFLVRTLNDFCRTNNDERFDYIEEKMPEVTRLGFYIQRYTNSLVDRLREAEAAGQDGNEGDSVEQEFIVEQLLHMALTLDYSDEVGRRKMFSLLRETLTIPELPEEITKLSIELLRLVCGTDLAGEREFCGVVLEAVAEVHDTIASEPSLIGDSEDSFHSARSEVSDATVKEKPEKKLLNVDPEQDEEKAIQEILVNMKCLHIAQCMLQNVEGNLKANVHLVTMLNNLVVPAVRSHEAPIRERGLLCLGLCCILDKVSLIALLPLCTRVPNDSQSLADENLTLFLHCFAKGHLALQATSLHILCDIFTAHPSVLAPPPAPPATANDGAAPPPPAVSQKQLLRPFSKGLKAAHAPEVQTAAAVSLCKFLLLEIVSSPNTQSPPPSDPSDSPKAESTADDEAGELLRQLAVAFFDAAGEAASLRDNPAARQALSYFLPAFAHGRAEHAATIARVAPAVLHAVVLRRAEEAELALDSDDDEDVAGGAGSADGSKVKLKTVGEMLADWTDPRKVVVPDEGAADRWDEAGRKEGRSMDGYAHLVLAEGALERALAHGCAKDERKALLSMLGKLYVSPHSTPDLTRQVLEVAREAADAKLALDALSRNALNKFVAGLEKAIVAVEGKEKPARGRKSVAVSGAVREAGAEMTVIEEETAMEADDVKTEIDEDVSGGDGVDEDQEEAAES